MSDHPAIQLKPLTPATWALFETLMGEKGGCGGCWCMAFRLSSKEFTANKYAGNKRLMKGIVAGGRPVGLIAVLNNAPVGWIALAPREDHPRIDNSRSFKRIDDMPVWSITCFFIRKDWRRRGLSRLLIGAVVEYARQQKIRALEAYPMIPYDTKAPAAFLWTGVLSAFLANSFRVVRQSWKSRAMVRLEL